MVSYLSMCVLMHMQVYVCTMTIIVQVHVHMQVSALSQNQAGVRVCICTVSPHPHHVQHFKLTKLSRFLELFQMNTGCNLSLHLKHTCVRCAY